MVNFSIPRKMRIPGWGVMGLQLSEFNVFRRRGQVRLSAAIFAGSESNRGVLCWVEGFYPATLAIFWKNPDQGFSTFLEWCVDTVGRRNQSVKGHFRHSGLTIEYSQNYSNKLHRVQNDSDYVWSNNAKFNPLCSGPCIDGTGFTSATETDYDDAPFLFHYVQVLEWVI